MQRSRHRFGVRQRVHYYPEGRASKKLTGPWTVIGIVRQPDCDVRYRIRKRSTELVALVLHAANEVQRMNEDHPVTLKHPPGPPMTLGKMRAQGVHRLIAFCLNDACRHIAGRTWRATISYHHYPS